MLLEHNVHNLMHCIYLWRTLLLCLIVSFVKKGLNPIVALMHIMAGLASHCAQHSRVACVCFGFFGVSHIAHISSPQTALSSEPRSNRMWPEQHVLCPLPPNAHCAAFVDINSFFFLPNPFLAITLHIAYESFIYYFAPWLKCASAGADTYIFPDTFMNFFKCLYLSSSILFIDF